MQQQRHFSTTSLIFLAAFASFGAVLPSAALTIIASYFNVSGGAAENVMTLYLAGYALAQLTYGPLANSIGRRRALIIGISVAVLANILGSVAAFLKMFDLYLLTRLLSGFGAGAGFIVSMILIRDVYDHLASRKIFARLILAFSFVPFIAIALGGVLAHHGNWQILNWLLLAYSALNLIFVLRIIETLASRDRVCFRVRSLLAAYSEILANSAYRKLIIVYALSVIINYSYNGLAPLVLMQKFNLSVQTYGYLSFLPGIGLLLGAYLSQSFAHRLSGYRFVQYASFMMLIASLILSLTFKTKYLNLELFYSLSILLFCGQAMAIANAGMEALTHVKDHANGSSLMNAFALAAGSVVVSVSSHLLGMSSLVFPLVLFGASLISMLLISF